MTSPSVYVADNSCGAVVPACGLQRVDNRGLKLAPPPQTTTTKTVAYTYDPTQHGYAQYYPVIVLRLQ